MTTTETNDTSAELVPVEAILAKLLLLRHNGNLPGILRLTTFSSAVHIGFAATADRDAWCDALGGDAHSGTPCTFDNGDTRHSLHIGDWHGGWDISLWADVPPAAAVPSPLDAETIAALASVAAGEQATPVPPVANERVDEIVDILNGHRAYEVVHDRDLVNGRGVNVADVMLCDANLGKAIEWALTQPDVEATFGPDGEKASVELTDGTCIDWIPTEKQWSVVVADPAEVVAA